MDKATFDNGVKELTERLQAVQKAIGASGICSVAIVQGEITAMDLLVREALSKENKSPQPLNNDGSIFHSTDKGIIVIDDILTSDSIPGLPEMQQSLTIRPESNVYLSSEQLEKSLILQKLIKEGKLVHGRAPIEPAKAVVKKEDVEVPILNEEVKAYLNKLKAKENQSPQPLKGANAVAEMGNTFQLGMLPDLQAGSIQVDYGKFIGTEEAGEGYLEDVEVPILNKEVKDYLNKLRAKENGYRTNEDYSHTGFLQID